MFQSENPVIANLIIDYFGNDLKGFNISGTVPSYVNL